MIVRIMGDGQWEVPDDALARLNVLDDLVTQAVEDRDEEALASILSEMGDLVRRLGTRAASGVLRLSDLIVPAADTPLHEVREWLQESRVDDGLIPG
ncbi:hypothetical protein GCM10009785_18650 [Brooklawnia cerclae]|uniref:PspA-associated domain-containing protein n=1 Tax=Brooklawnia cerclae TaxID=349934 RepID=A0ABX0SLF3_9ACTN|nr:hypothetical protein [Brooklawnia cerclae]NIH57562.1 hypothetical protein [Brooklawnia cerclae]